MHGNDMEVGPRPEGEQEREEARREETVSRRRTIILVTLALVGVAIGHRLLMAGGIGQTAAMFIGLPALLSIGLSFTPRARTVTGSIMRGITFVLLMFGVLLIEGFICILMAAPLFYVIGLVVGICKDRARVRADMMRYRCVVWGVLGLMALEGVVPALSFERENEVVVERELAGSMAEVRRCLLEGPELAEGRLPWFLRLGFPLPAGIVKEGEGGWRIFFEEGREKPTELRVRVREEGERVVRYVIEEDGTKIGEWLTWHEGRWEFEETGEGTVRARLSVRYRRELDPAWYFGPLEQHGVRVAAGYFADELFRGMGDGQ